MGLAFRPRIEAAAALSRRRRVWLYAPRVWFDKDKRNSLFVTITNKGLDPNAFDLTEETGSPSTWKVTHRATGANFSFFSIVSGFIASRAQVGDRDVTSTPNMPWHSQLSRFAQWLDEVERDRKTPDLWAEFQRTGGEIPKPGPDVGNTPFTDEERSQIAKQLQSIKDDFADSQTLTGHQLRLLEERLDHLAEAAGQLDRIRWRDLAVGTILMYATEAAVPPDKWHHLLTMLFQPLAHLFGHPVPGLPTP